MYDCYFIGRLSTDSLPDVNLLYIYPLLKQLHDNLYLYIKKQPTSDVLKVKKILLISHNVTMDFRFLATFIGWRYFKTFAVDQLVESLVVACLLQCGAYGIVTPPSTSLIQ